jgi:voltage-gated sodium channel
MSGGKQAMTGFRARLRAGIERKGFQRLVVVLIAINAVILGLETSAEAVARFGAALILLDRIILAVFVVEIAARIVAHGARFFRDPWSLFDFFVVAIALVPASGPLAILRTLRVLRVLRLVSTIPRMRRVVEALLEAIPGMGAILTLMCMIFYVGSVIATNLFGSAFPEWFGSIGASLYTLFQIMTLESWSMGIVRPVLTEFPFAWAFFVPFIIITTFSVLNLFIAVIVSAMQSRHHEEQEQENVSAHKERELLLEQVKLLRSEVAAIRAQLETR